MGGPRNHQGTPGWAALGTTKEPPGWAALGISKEPLPWLGGPRNLQGTPWMDNPREPSKEPPPPGRGDPRNHLRNPLAGAGVGTSKETPVGRS